MDSSPRPKRRFSRWKTTQHTFVLGGKKFNTGSKDNKRTNLKAVQERGNKGCSSTPSQPSHKEGQPLDSDLSHDVSSLDAQISKHSHEDVDHCLQGSTSKECYSISNKDQSQSEGVASTSANALSVLSPNVSTTAKDSVAGTSESRQCNVDRDTSNGSELQPVSSVHCDQFATREEQDSNPESVNTDKENSLVQVNGSSCTGSQVGRASVSLGTSELEDDTDTETSSRRQSLRDRSRLASSSFFKRNNYPFVTSKKERIKEKSKQLFNSSTSPVLSEKKQRNSIKSEKTLKKDRKGKNNVCISNKKRVNAQIEQSASITSPKISSYSESVSESKRENIDCSRREILRSGCTSKSQKRKDKDQAKEEHTEIRGYLNSSKNKHNEKANSSKSNCIVQSKEIVSTCKSSESLSDFHSNVSISHDSSSARYLRNRSALVTPQLQYPAKYMSALQLNSLSVKAQKLLLLSKDITETKTKQNSYFEQNLFNKVKTPKLSSLPKNIVDPKTKQNCYAGQKLATKVKDLKLSSVTQDISETKRKKNSYSEERSAPIEEGKGKGKITTADKPKFSKHTQQEQFSKDLPPREMNDQMSNVHKNLKLSTSTADTRRKKTSKQNVDGHSRCDRMNRLPKQSLVDLNSHFEESQDPPLNSRQRRQAPNEILTLKCKENALSQSITQASSSKRSSGKTEMLLDVAQEDKESKQAKKHRNVSSYRQNRTNTLNETVTGSRKSLKRRRLFDDPFNESRSKKFKFGWDIYENVGRDILLWSENGEARKGSSVTSLDVIFNDLIELEDYLKDSESEYFHQRLIGKTLGRMKKSLKSKMHEIEKIKELKADVKRRRDNCSKIIAEITEQERKDKRFQRQLEKTKESEQKTLQKWMKDLKSLIVSNRKM